MLHASTGLRQLRNGFERSGAESDRTRTSTSRGCPVDGRARWRWNRFESFEGNLAAQGLVNRVRSARLALVLTTAWSCGGQTISDATMPTETGRPPPTVVAESGMVAESGAGEGALDDGEGAGGSDLDGSAMPGLDAAREIDGTWPGSGDGAQPVGDASTTGADATDATGNSVGSCPSAFGSSEGARCDSQQVCDYPQGRCGCAPCQTANGQKSQYWHCEPWKMPPMPCPGVAPEVGSACSPQLSLCEYIPCCSLGYGMEVVLQCRGPTWTRGGCLASCFLASCP
jgi:hypothetical protein